MDQIALRTAIEHMHASMYSALQYLHSTELEAIMHFRHKETVHELL